MVMNGGDVAAGAGDIELPDGRQGVLIGFLHRVGCEEYGAPDRPGFVSR
jgi:hypothetical protein